MVKQPLPQSTCLAVIAALALETHSSTPAGLYLCAYWIIANVLYAFRELLSWRHVTPWLLTHLAAAFWVIAFECFVIVVTRGASNLTISYLSVQVARLGIATAFGMFLCRHWLNPLVDTEAEES